MAQKKRIFWMDVSRVFAILSISINHAVNRTYDNYIDQFLEFQTISLASTILKTAVTVFSRIGVPIFLMISGALLLNKVVESEQDIKRFYQHNLLPLFTTSEIWYFIMFWFIVFVQPDNRLFADFGVGGTFIRLIGTMLFIDQITLGSMWYIPVILCIYMLIPAVAMIIRKVSWKTLGLPILIVFLSGMFFPTVNAFLSLTEDGANLTFELRENNLFSVYFLYIISGYLIGRGVMSGLKEKTVFAGALLSYIGCCAFQLYAYSRPMNCLVDESFAGILICAAFVFDMIRRKADCLKYTQNMITYLAKISFGIYFIHIIIMETLSWNLDFYLWRRSVKMLFLEAVSISGSIAVIAILSKVKLLKKYMFMIKN